MCYSLTGDSGPASLHAQYPHVSTPTKLSHRMHLASLGPLLASASLGGTPLWQGEDDFLTYVNDMGEDIVSSPSGKVWLHHGGFP